ncbi:hypothetical protein BGZ46_008137 [Entomortierella lignicola]|nr:hypothetical protein BGZ46_008137 [Entomortierella lignicola]
MACGSKVQKVVGGKSEFDYGQDIYFLEKQQILEHGLSPDFVKRLDLATFAHEIFTHKLDLKRCKKGLKGYTIIFLSDEAKDIILSNSVENPLLTIFLQLVAIILALHISSTSKKVTKQAVLALCNSDTIPELSRISKMNITPVIDLAVRVSSDKKLLLDLYNDTLIRIIKVMEQLVLTLEPVAATDLVEELEEMRHEDMLQLYKGQTIDNYQVEDWLTIQDQQKDTKIQSSPVLQETSYDDYDDVYQNEDVNESTNYMMEVDQVYDDDKENRQYTPKSTQSDGLSKSSSRKSSANSKSAGKRKADLDPDYMEESEELPPITMRRRKQDIIDEVDGFVTDPESNTTISNTKRRVQPTVARNQAASNIGTSKSTAATTTTTKQRKATVHWTDKEVARLMDLVDNFRYKENEIVTKKRTIKWSRLKRYDEDHGDILHLRSQVQLKDKYRELTDNGAHRRQVMEIRARKPTENNSR